MDSSFIIYYYIYLIEYFLLFYINYYLYNNIKKNDIKIIIYYYIIQRVLTHLKFLVKNNSTMTSDSEKRLCGSVKWFNNKHQYGFITFINNDGDSEDIFVHSKDIVSNKKYKFLNKGEYVEFDILSYTNIDDENEDETETNTNDDGNEPKIKAGNVTGINKSGLQMEHLNVVHSNVNSSSTTHQSSSKSNNGGWQTVGKRH